jgi:membrane-associated PAP2 superfamily phosphatase
MHWIGADNWWVNDLVHVGGRWFMRGLVVVALGLCIVASFRPGLRHWRRPAAYFVATTVLSVGIVGLFKTVTNVDCPWDLSEFGGRFPVVALFADRPDSLRHGHCFPAAHAASGYALLALYFVFRERSATLARLGLAIGIAAGLLFGIAQQSRGAHFVSHDVWSAFLVWVIALSVYTWMFRARLWDSGAPPSESA